METTNLTDEYEHPEKCIDESLACSNHQHLTLADLSSIMKVLFIFSAFALLPSAVVGLILGLSREISAQIYCAFLITAGCVLISHRISEQKAQRLLLTRELSRLRSEIAKAKLLNIS